MTIKLQVYKSILFFLSLIICLGSCTVLKKSIISENLHAEPAVNTTTKITHCSSTSAVTPSYGFSVGKNKVGDVLKIYCQDYFHLKPEILSQPYERECLPNGTWSNKNVRCVQDKDAFCDPPSLPPNSSIVEATDSNFPLFAVIQLTCSKGFREEGNSTAQCDDKKRWVINFACHLIQSCPEPLVPENSEILPSNDVPFEKGDVILIGCKAGYLPRGSTTATCTSNFTWSVTQLRECRRECRGYVGGPGVQVGAGGQQEYGAGDKVELTCKPRYRGTHVNRTVAVCTDAGTWDDNSFSCCQTCPNFQPLMPSYCVGEEMAVSETLSLKCCPHSTGGKWQVSCVNNNKLVILYQQHPEYFYLPVLALLLGAVAILLGIRMNKRNKVTSSEVIVVEPVSSISANSAVKETSPTIAIYNVNHAPAPSKHVEHF